MAIVESIKDCPSFPEVSGVEFRHLCGWIGYAVSSDGNVWSCRPKGFQNTRGCAKLRWRRLLATVFSCGYRYVTVSFAGKSQKKRVARLIAEVFVGTPLAGQQVCHNDGIKTHDTADNLRWDTASGNQRDRFKHGTHLRGLRNPATKVTPEQVLEIRKTYPHLTCRALGERYGVSGDCIWRIVHRQNWGWL